jgi:nicotinamide-nucleotide adenylyltransferase
MADTPSTIYSGVEAYRAWRSQHPGETIPVYIGRFQPFHLGHLKCLKRVREKYRNVIIGIGSAQHERSARNPLSYAERKSIVEAALEGSRLAGDLEFDSVFVVPVFDIGADDAWMDTIQMVAGKGKFSIYSNNDWVRSLAERWGVPVEGKMERYGDDIRASTIRAMIQNDNAAWEDLVPAPCAKLLRDGNLGAVIKSCCGVVNDREIERETVVSPGKLKIGFDLHGVVDKKPAHFVALANSVRRGGGEVHVITGQSRDGVLERELLSYNGGIKWWDAIFSITDQLLATSVPYTIDEIGGKAFPDADWDSAKAKYCEKEGMTFHVDDSSVFGKFFKTPYLLFQQ